MKVCTTSVQETNQNQTNNETSAASINKYGKKIIIMSALSHVGVSLLVLWVVAILVWSYSLAYYQTTPEWYSQLLQVDEAVLVPLFIHLMLYGALLLPEENVWSSYVDWWNTENKEKRERILQDSDVSEKRKTINVYSRTVVATNIYICMYTTLNIIGTVYTTYRLGDEPTAGRVTALVFVAWALVSAVYMAYIIALAASQRIPVASKR